MAKYDLLHEAKTPEHEIAEKYNIATYEEYGAFCKNRDPEVMHNWVHNGGPAPPRMAEVEGWSAIQRLAFSIVYWIHIAGEKQRGLIINREFAERLLEEEGEIPKEIEGVSIVFDPEEELFKIKHLI